MKVLIYLNGRRDPLTYEGDRIDVIDFDLNGINYKQIRCFKKGISKSELIDVKLIQNIKYI